MTNPLPLSSRIYHRLLLFYPDDLRRDYGADMALLFAEDLEGARREAGVRGVIRVWRCALSEFLRFGLPSWASSPAVRVHAIALALFIAMVIGMALRYAPDTLSRAAHVVLLLPAMSSPLLAALAVWACRGDAVISMHLAGNTREDVESDTSYPR